MDEQKAGPATMTVTEARKRLKLSEAWVYRLINTGVLRTAETGGGRGKHTTVLSEDVEREAQRRRELLQKRLDGL